jgi:hypothetical protein
MIVGKQKYNNTRNNNNKTFKIGQFFEGQFVTEYYFFLNCPLLAVSYPKETLVQETFAIKS